jgi:hypothetical protein
VKIQVKNEGENEGKGCKGNYDRLAQIIEQFEGGGGEKTAFES